MTSTSLVKLNASKQLAALKAQVNDFHAQRNAASLHLEAEIEAHFQRIQAKRLDIMTVLEDDDLDTAVKLNFQIEQERAALVGFVKGRGFQLPDKERNRIIFGIGEHHNELMLPVILATNELSAKLNQAAAEHAATIAAMAAVKAPRTRRQRRK